MQAIIGGITAQEVIKVCIHNEILIRLSTHFHYLGYHWKIHADKAIFIF